jgi:hypothetical protein
MAFAAPCSGVSADKQYLKYLIKSNTYKISQLKSVALLRQTAACTCRTFVAPHCHVLWNAQNKKHRENLTVLFV